MYDLCYVNTIAGSVSVQKTINNKACFLENTRIILLIILFEIFLKISRYLGCYHLKRIIVSFITEKSEKHLRGLHDSHVITSHFPYCIYVFEKSPPASFATFACILFALKCIVVVVLFWHLVGTGLHIYLTFESALFPFLDRERERLII